MRDEIFRTRPDGPWGPPSRLYTVKVNLSRYRPLWFQQVEAPEFVYSRHRKVVLCQPYAPAVFTPRKDSWYSFLLEAESPQGHNATERIKSLKNSSDSIGNRTRDLLVCSAVPQPTAPPRTPSLYNGYPVISGGKAAGAWRYTLLSSAEVKSSGIPLLFLCAVMACYRVNFVFFLIINILSALIVCVAEGSTGHLGKVRQPHVVSGP